MLKKTIHFLKRNDGSLSNKVFRSGFWIGTSSITLAILGFSKNIILARLLTPEIFGLMGICLMVMRGIQIFTETGFGAALIHRRGTIEDAKETAFTILVIRGIILALILFLISPLVSTYYDRPVLKSLIQALSLVLILQSFYNINVISMEKALDYKKIAYLQQLVSIINFIVVVTFAYFLRSVWALILGQIITTLIRVLLSYLIIPGSPNFGLNKKIAKSLLSYGKYITGLTIVLFIASEIDNALIGKIIGMEMLGYYVVAYFLANIPATHISKVASRILLPAYSKIQDDILALQRAYLQVLKLIATVTIPVSFGIAILAPEIVGLVYGEKWLPAITPLRILCIFGCVRSIIAIYGYLYNAIGKPNISFYLGLFRLLLISLLIYPLTIRFGVVGASWSVTIPIVLELMASLAVMKRVINAKYMDMCKIFAEILFKTGIVSMFVVVIKYYFPINSILSLGSLITVAMIIYFLSNFRYTRQLIFQFNS